MMGTFYYWLNKGNPITECVGNINVENVYRSLSMNQRQRCFRKFRAGNHSLENRHCSERPVDIEVFQNSFDIKCPFCDMFYEKNRLPLFDLSYFDTTR